MKIIVSVKRVADYEAQLDINDSQDFIKTDNINMITNPFDEIGVEEALRIKKRFGGEVICISVGGKDSLQNIRTALAMGADRGILVLDDDQNQNYFMNACYTASILKTIIEREKPNIIIMGKQAIDTDNHQICEYLAAKMNIGNASQANHIDIDQS